MNVVRSLLLVAIFCVCAVAGALLIPTARLLPTLNAALHPHAILSNARGAAFAGSAQLQIPAINAETPISWRLRSPTSFLFTVGPDGEIVANAISLRTLRFVVTSAIHLRVAHTALNANVSITKDSNLVVKQNRITVDGTANAPTLVLSLPTLRAQFDTVSASLGPSGNLSITAQGDASVVATGTINDLPYARGNIELQATPMGRNAAFDSALRSTFTARDNNKYVYTTRF